MTTGAFSQNVSKVISELKLVQITFLSIEAFKIGTTSYHGVD